MRKTRSLRRPGNSRIGLVLVVALLAAFAAAPAALAQDAGNNPPTAQASFDPGSPGSSGTGGDNAAPADDTGLRSSIGSLPFTGLDLLILAGITFLLTGTGLTLRWLSAPRGPIA